MNRVPVETMTLGPNTQQAHSARLAEQHYSLQLKRKVWAGWHALVQGRWKMCRARAEVYVHLSADYEDKMAEHVAAVDAAQAEIQSLQAEREHYEESMKKAFMRGACPQHGGPQHVPHWKGTHGAQPARCSTPPARSWLRLIGPPPLFSPLHFDPPVPSSQSDRDSETHTPWLQCMQQFSLLRIRFCHH
ncbi:uncharacterized protein ACWYII_009483 [Salvelinus alpinus]